MVFDNDGRIRGGSAMPEFSSLLPVNSSKIYSNSIRDARPRAWCGWYARHFLAGVDPGIAYNLARNWAHWGVAVAASIGAIVVWPHHVGMITGRSADGQWIVKSGNDGHAVRERPRSLAGAIAFRRG